MNIPKFALTLIVLISSLNSFGQFDRRHERKIKLADDSAHKKDDLFIMHTRIHYGLLLGIHQGKQTSLELGIHRTKRMVNGIYACSASYEYNLQNKSQGLSVGAWLGAWLGAGLFVATNTTDFIRYSLTLRPMVGFEYYYAGLYYTYNINFFKSNSTDLNTHSISLRVHLAFITKKGKGISKW